MNKLFFLILAGILFGITLVQDTFASTYYSPYSRYTYYPSRTYTPISPVYPGCSSADIIIGGQIWASCNALTKNRGSIEKSGWFFANDLRASFVSYNGIGAPLEWQGKVSSSSSWIQGPCAKGYRMPTRSDWETVLYYARLNNTSVANILNLPRNGGFRGYKDSDGDVMIESEQDVLGNYWSSTIEYNNRYFPIIMRISGTYQNYRIDGTYYSESESGYDWQYGENGLSLVRGTASDLANVRCIKN